MNTCGGTHTEPCLDFERWRALFRSHCAGFSLEKGDCDAFVGSFRPRHVNGLKALNISSNIDRADRTRRDARSDGIDRYALFFLMSGQIALIQNEQTTNLSAGDCALIDLGRPISLVTANTFGKFVSVHLPRRSVMSHLGVEPKGGVSWRSDTLAVRLLSGLVLDRDAEPDAQHASAEHYMQLAICDLLGALVASSDLLSYSSHAEKMFARVSDIVKAHFADPAVRPRDIAKEAGISLRCLQKLFTVRGTTCGRFIQRLRLDQAARLIHLRNLTKAGQPLTEIAYACGFQDYAYFARTFRRRFGYSPGQWRAQHARMKNEAFLAGEHDDGNEEPNGKRRSGADGP
jgi:AraC family transcriptional activator of tynA and feaB